MEKKGNSFSRRKFLGNAAVGTIAAVGATQLLSSCSSGGTTYTREVELPPLLDQAPDGEPIRAGLIGCGGRGTGAAKNFLSAGQKIELVAIADVFQDRIDTFREEIKKKKVLKLQMINALSVLTLISRYWSRILTMSYWQHLRISARSISRQL